MTGTGSGGCTGTATGGMTKFWPLVTPTLTCSVVVAAATAVDSTLADGGSGFDCRYDLVSKVTNNLSTNPFVSC